MGRFIALLLLLRDPAAAMPIPRGKMARAFDGTNRRTPGRARSIFGAVDLLAPRRSTFDARIQKGEPDALQMLVQGPVVGLAVAVGGDDAVGLIVVTKLWDAFADAGDELVGAWRVA